MTVEQMKSLNVGDRVVSNVWVSGGEWEVHRPWSEESTVGVFCVSDMDHFDSIRENNCDKWGLVSEVSP